MKSKVALERPDSGVGRRETTIEASYANAPNKTVDVGGTMFAYRELGLASGVPDAQPQEMS